MLDGNRLASLPPLGKLQQLRILSADNNVLTSLPAGLAACVKLEASAPAHSPPNFLALATA